MNITATGSGAKDTEGKAADGNLDVIGSTVSGKNVTLTAAKDVNLLSAEGSSLTKTTSSSSSAGISVGLSSNNQGVTVFGNASGSKDNGEIITHTETVVTAKDTLTIKSGADTNLIGAQAKGNTVKADVGGNLNLASQQDKDNYNESNWSAGGSLNLTNGVGSISASKGKIDSTYTSVTEQTGIYAGTGGFDIHVGKNTDLKGAVIASDATPDKNKLDTGTLTWSDLENKAEYSAGSTAYSTSLSDGKLSLPSKVPGMPAKGNG